MTTLLQNGDRLCGITKPLFRSLCENILSEGTPINTSTFHGRMYGPFVMDETLSVTPVYHTKQRRIYVSVEDFIVASLLLEPTTQKTNANAI